MAQRREGVNRPSFNPISCIQILFGSQLRYLNFALPLEPPYHFDLETLLDLGLPGVTK